MKRINMAKYGFVRDPEADFSDDGNRFTCYKVGEYENLRISKLVSDGNAYLSADVTSNLTYEIYSKLPHYQEATWKYNGVTASELTDADMVNFYKACCAYAQECIDTEYDTKFPTVKEIEERCKLVQDRYRRDYDEAAELVAKATADGTILSIDNYQIAYIFGYLRNLKAGVDIWEPKTRAPRLVGKAESLKLMEPDYHELRRDSFYVKSIKEYLKKA